MHVGVWLPALFISSLGRVSKTFVRNLSLTLPEAASENCSVKSKVLQDCFWLLWTKHLVGVQILARAQRSTVDWVAEYKLTYSWFVCAWPQSFVQTGHLSSVFFLLILAFPSTTIYHDVLGKIIVSWSIWPLQVLFGYFKFCLCCDCKVEKVMLGTL